MAEQLRLDIPWPARAARQVVFFAIIPDAVDGARLTTLGKQIGPARHSRKSTRATIDGALLDLA